MNLQSILETLLDQRGDDNPSCTPPVTPKLPSKCPLFCCFYSEFDIKKGPVISYQSPKGLMDQDINISTERIQEMLARTFEEVVERDEAKHIVSLHTTSENKCADIAESYTTSSDALPGTPQSSNIASASSSHPKSIFDTPESLVSSRPAPTTIMHAAGLSIFDSTSEYIITGSELTSKTITLSTHSFHVMTRPTMISNPRYERNAHLFSVGFLLRRAADPNPFRPLLSKLAITLQVMEEESQFLTLPEQRPKLQTLLERVLLALNSSDWECNLLLSRSNVLHLKLYHPPKPDASPVFEHEVPILLRKDSQLQMVCSHFVCCPWQFYKDLTFL